eukprot:CAMPEP_0176042290 /NCGR_PEP_ID=MMETSP0120_2-20121206/20982_1 /TAXON_ID=160619 /ORGANISM="Kryptoperidinium foliaceum, Strain CCMP 1326" /LENGTH=449 /DNA_ID=CAMNT_0017375697 /DNA_START=43 /DNA_END=1392 /DNA_ORIENTATION=+
MSMTHSKSLADGGAVVKKASSIRKVASYVADRVTLRKPILDETWQVGCCYQARDVVKLWPSMDMANSPLGAVAPGHGMHVVQLIEGPAVTIAFVLPRHQMRPGWVLLEDRRLAEQPVLKAVVPGVSWTLRGRYRIASETTMREECGLSSAPVGKLYTDDEVLLLEVDLNDDVGDEAPRLRMKVASVRGCIGWITAITTDGVQLIDSQNLLGPEMVQIRASHRSRKVSTILLGSAVSKTKSYESSAPGAIGMWLPGGQYRVLQAADLKEEAAAESRVVARVRPGMVVRVVNVCKSKEQNRPMAFVTVHPDDTVRGYVFCQSPNGFDIIDTRDLEEVSKVEAWLAQQIVEAEKEGEGSDTEGDEGSTMTVEAADGPVLKAEEDESAQQAEGAEAEQEKPKKRSKSRRRSSGAQPTWTGCTSGDRALPANMGPSCFVGCFAPKKLGHAQSAH